jgi:lysine-ketoglutarate reductase/saccharopine dehydrogenase-like protein (TIGR00300 family)
MVSEVVELRGHILDSLLLPKVLDEITLHAGRFHVEELTVGRTREDLSYARLRIEAADEEALSSVLGRIQHHGAVLVREEDARLEPAPADGVFPPGFHVTSNHPTFVRQGEQWLPVTPVRMDCAIRLDASRGEARTLRFADVRAGDPVVVGHQGVRVQPMERNVRKTDPFEFMASEVSAEKPKSVAIRAVAETMRLTREAGQKILLVAGPAVVHTGASPHVIRLIEAGYIDLLFAGNALAVHDVERAFYGTALGVHMDDGRAVEAGHQHHLHAINRIRSLGGLREAVRRGELTAGIMHACIEHGVEFILAGSVRDDGPLPEVITDMVRAQQVMAEKVQGVGFALMVATMLHSIATGNLLPASCRIACVDINASVVTKLADRGSFQSVGLVTDVEPFFRELVGCLGLEEADGGAR